MSDYSMINFERVKDQKSDTKNYSDTKIKILKIAFVILCILLLTEVIIYKMAIPCFSSPKVTFSGIKTYKTKELGKKLLVMNSTNWLNFDAKQAQSILASIPGIEKVAVVKRFPDKIYIHITERTPVAMTFINEKGKSIPVQIDRNGVLFTQNTENHAADVSVPIISGLPIEHLTDGMRIPEKYKGLVDQISYIRSLPQDYFAAISEICVVPKEYGNYELTLIPVNSHTKVLTDRTLTEEALQYMMVVLDVVDSIEPDVSEIDLRYGAVSYRKK